MKPGTASFLKVVHAQNYFAAFWVKGSFASVCNVLLALLLQYSDGTSRVPMLVTPDNDTGFTSGRTGQVAR